MLSPQFLFQKLNKMAAKLEAFIAVWDRCCTLFFTGDEDYSSQVQALSSLWTNDYWVNIYTKDACKLKSKLETATVDFRNDDKLIVEWNDWVRRVQFLWNFCTKDARFLTYVVDQALFPGLQMKFELMMKIHGCLKELVQNPDPVVMFSEKHFLAERKDWLLMEEAGFVSPLRVDWLTRAYIKHVDCKMK